MCFIFVISDHTYTTELSASATNSWLSHVNRAMGEATTNEMPVNYNYSLIK